MEEKSVVLRDKRKIVLEDDNDILISLISGDKIIHAFHVSCPPGGYGGGMLLLSPSEQYLLFSFYSGESEEACMIFRIHASCLESVHASGYLQGEGASYVFSDSEEFLYQALPVSVGPWYEEDAETDENENLYFKFCEINILNIKSKTVEIHYVHVFLSDDWEEDTWEEPPRLTGITDNRSLCMAMPWGREELGLPLDDVVIFRPGERKKS